MMKNLTKDWLKQLPISNIENIRPVSGGDINDSYEVIANGQQYFMKVQPQKGKEFFAHEVQGLKMLGEHCRVPEIVDYGEIDGDGYLIQKWLNLSPFGDQSQIGTILAKVHECHNDKFGLDNDFKMGRIPKNNTWQDSWTTFFIKQRLDPLVQMAIDKGGFTTDDINKYNNLKQQFYVDMKDHKPEPSLLHGDFWSGNFTFTNDGKGMLIDPDVYFGDREFDIGVSTVFGGFDDNFYSAYNKEYPLDEGWQNRIKYYQFFYLLMHYVLFGGMFKMSVDRILNQF